MALTKKVSNCRLRPKQVFPIFLCLLGILFFYLLTATPLALDDYDDFFLWNSQKRLVSAGDYFANLYLHYLNVSPRLVPHCFIELFPVWLGKNVFNIANTLMFLLFLCLLCQYARIPLRNNKEFFPSLCFITCLLFLLFPGFNDVFLWTSGACNYLWTGVLVLFFLILSEREQQKGAIKKILLFLFGFICGWTNEAMTIGVACGLFVYYAICSWKITPQRTILFFGFIFGVLMLIVSPVSTARFFANVGGRFSAVGIAKHLISALLAMGNLRFTLVLVCLLIVLALFKKIPNTFFKNNLPVFLMLSFSFLFVLATNHSSARSRFGIELFSFILTIRLLSPIIARFPSVFSILSCLILLCVLVPTVYYSYLNDKEYKRCLGQILNTDTSVIATEEVSCPPVFDRLLVRCIPSEKSAYYGGFMGDRWMERYYGKEGLCFLPKRFLDTCQDKNAFRNFDLRTGLPFYVKSIDPTVPVNGIRLCLSPAKSETVPFYYRPFMDLFERWATQEVIVDKWRVVTLPQGQTFLFVGKSPLVSERVSFIDIL